MRHLGNSPTLRAAMEILADPGPLRVAPGEVMARVGCSRTTVDEARRVLAETAPPVGLAALRAMRAFLSTPAAAALTPAEVGARFGFPWETAHVARRDVRLGLAAAEGGEG